MKRFILIILSATALVVAGCGGGSHDNRTSLFGGVDLVGGTHHPRVAIASMDNNDDWVIKSSVRLDSNEPYQAFDRLVCPEPGLYAVIVIDDINNDGRYQRTDEYLGIYDYDLEYLGDPYYDWCYVDLDGIFQYYADEQSCDIYTYYTTPAAVAAKPGASVQPQMRSQPKMMDKEVGKKAYKALLLRRQGLAPAQ